MASQTQTGEVHLSLDSGPSPGAVGLLVVGEEQKRLGGPAARTKLGLLTLSPSVSYLPIFTYVRVLPSCFVLFLFHSSLAFNYCGPLPHFACINPHNCIVMQHAFGISHAHLAVLRPGVRGPSSLTDMYCTVHTPAHVLIYVQQVCS